MSLPAEGEYLLVPPPPLWEDCVSLPPSPAEGEFPLVPPLPPWEDCVSLPPPPTDGEYLLVPPPPPWEDCWYLPPPPADGEYLLGAKGIPKQIFKSLSSTVSTQGQQKAKRYQELLSLRESLSRKVTRMLRKGSSSPTPTASSKEALPL
ncbi:UNVERIFIED_CONTAM: hypothetical protein FKN15_047464 [Acipenser sinensis]